jgi:Gas vesicle synthesis protein GvpL/GvpF
VNEDAQAVYVYGVMPAAECPALRAAGVEGSEVRAVEHASLAALLSSVGGDSLEAAREVRAHWRVLEAVSEKATVLPIRFGTVMESEVAVRERLLEPNVERLEVLLRELSGRIQLSVKGDYDEDRLMREIVSGSSVVAKQREHIKTLPEEAGYYERIRLGELVAAEVEHRRAEDTRLAIETLEPLAVAVKEEELRQLDSAFNLAFLVDREGQDAFTRGVNGLAQALGDRVELRYVGPLPPYSFADVELDAEAGAWA